MGAIVYLLLGGIGLLIGAVYGLVIYGTIISVILSAALGGLIGCTIALIALFLFGSRR